MPEADRAAENAPSTEEMQAEFIARCAHAAWGRDALCAVTRDERPLKQVDDNPGISLRMVQRCLTSVYEKTDAQTCAGFTEEFMGGDKLD